MRSVGAFGGNALYWIIPSKYFALSAFEEAVGTHRQRADELDIEAGVANLANRQGTRLLVHEQHDGFGAALRMFVMWLEKSTSPTLK